MTTHYAPEFRKQLKLTIKDAYEMNVEMTGAMRTFGLPLEVRRETKRVLGLTEQELRDYAIQLVQALLPGAPGSDPYDDPRYDLYARTVLINRDRLLTFVAPPELADRVRGEPGARLLVLKHVSQYRK